MKKYWMLVLLLYVFGVLLRLVGQLINGESVNFKSTFLLGEFDGSIDFDRRWTFRVILMFLLPLFFVKAVK